MTDQPLEVYTDWPTVQRQAAQRYERLVVGALVEAATAFWGPDRGRRWEIVALPAEAAWQAFGLVEPRPPSSWAYQKLGVRAVLAPTGELVALQVDDGEAFLALADTSEASLRRGLRHLVDQGLPVHLADQPPFARRRGLLSALRLLFQRG